MDWKHKGTGIAGAGGWLGLAMLDLSAFVIPAWVITGGFIVSLLMIGYGLSPWVIQGVGFLKKTKWRSPVYRDEAIPNSHEKPIQISWDATDTSCRHDFITSTSHTRMLHNRQFSLKISNALNENLTNVSVRVLKQSGMEIFDVGLPKPLRRKDGNPSTIINPLDHDYFELLRWEHANYMKVYLCFADGEVEIDHAHTVEFELTVRASAAEASQYAEKTYEFVQPTDRNSTDWHMGYIIMREKS